MPFFLILLLSSIQSYARAVYWVYHVNNVKPTTTMIQVSKHTSPYMVILNNCYREDLNKEKKKIA